MDICRDFYQINDTFLMSKNRASISELPNRLVYAIFSHLSDLQLESIKRVDKNFTLLIESLLNDRNNIRKASNLCYALQFRNKNIETLNKIAISKKNDTLADFVLNSNNNASIVLTTDEIIYIDHTSDVSWKRPIINRMKTLAAVIPGMGQLFLYAENEMLVLREIDGEPMLKTTTKRYPFSGAVGLVVRPEELLVLTESIDTHKKPALCCYDLKLKRKWKYEVDGGKNNFDLWHIKFYDFNGKTAVILKKDAILLNENGQVECKLNILINNIQYINNTFKASEKLLFLQSSQACYIVDVEAGQSRPFQSKVSLINSQLTLVKNGEWQGLVSRLSAKFVHHGIYDYPIAILDAQGDCINIINFEYEIKYFCLDAENNIIVYSGPSNSVYEKYGGCVSLKFLITILDERGNKLDKIKLNAPIRGPITVTQQGALSYVTEGELHLRMLNQRGEDHPS